MRHLLIVLALALMPLSSLLGSLLYLIWWLIPWRGGQRLSVRAAFTSTPVRWQIQPLSKTAESAPDSTSESISESTKSADDLPFDLPFQSRLHKQPRALNFRPKLQHGLGLFCLLSLLTLLSCAIPLWQLAGWLSRYLLPGLLIWGTYRALLSGRLQVRDLVNGLLLGSFLLACVGGINYLFHWQTHPQLLCFKAYGGFCLLDLLLLAEDRARGFSMHPNVLGALLMLSIPLWLWLLGVIKGLRKLPVLLALLWVSAVLLMSFSRAAWLGAALIGVWGSFWLLSASWRQGLWLLGILGLSGLGLTGSLQSILNRFLELGATQGSHLSRLMLWQGGLEMLLEHFWLGTGLLQLEPLLPAYLTPVPGGAGHLHNWYLQVAVESGLPAALCVFICLVVLLSKPKTLSSLGQACWLSWTAMLLSCLFDITLLDLRVSFMLCLLLGLLLQQRQLMRQINALPLKG